MNRWRQSVLSFLLFVSVWSLPVFLEAEEGKVPVFMDKVIKTDQEWKKILTPEQYRVLRKKGTERPFTGEYAASKEKGIYRCAACGQPLFGSDAKFESGTGWPSFWKPYSDKSVIEKEDRSFFMRRTEILCWRCESHLGHVFDDGPKPTGQRYCINSLSLKLDKG